MKDTIELEYRLAKYYLANLIFYFLPLLLSKPSLIDVGVSLVLLPPFLYGYFRAYRSSRANVWQPIVLMILCGAAATPFNSGSMSLFSFAGFFIGFFYRGSAYLCWLMAIGAVMLMLHVALGFTNYYFILFGGAITLGVSLIGLAQAKREESQRVLAQSETEIRRLAGALERERIARDLHDIMGHHLASIVLKADLASRLLAKGDNESCRSELNDLTQIARDSLAQVRAAVGQYKRKDIADIINGLGQRLREKGLGVEIDGDLPEMSIAQERELGLILTELVSNILRHSNANHCAIKTSQHQDDVILEVIDDGKASQIDEGHGLKGIRERLTALNGALTINTQNGFHATIRLPLWVQGTEGQ